MRVWRLTAREHRTLDGEGGRLYGGRWNSPGVPVVYASATLSLAVLETLVHADIADVPEDRRALEIDIPDDAIIALHTGQLARDWRTRPESHACRSLGDAWVRTGEATCLRVPSVVIPFESNYLINPRHPDAHGLRVVRDVAFELDQRLRR
ncbi:MAG: RES family NAD+ phosphorylase [Gemmatimonadaceae bacterium]